MSRICCTPYTAVLLVLALALTTIGCSAGDQTPTRATVSQAPATPPVAQEQSASAESETTEQAQTREAAESLRERLSDSEIAFRENALIDLASTRKATVLDQYLANPFPSPDASVANDRCWGRVGFALAAYKRRSQLARADDYMRSLREEFTLSRSGPADAWSCYFAMPLLWRIYLDPQIKAELPDDVRDDLLALMHEFIVSRSEVATANASTWDVVMSENHDAIQKSSYLLAARALMEAGAPYGPTLILADGNNVTEHYDAWSDYWQRYFRERALEGIGCEVASPIYSKYSLGAYYGVRDFARTAALKERADSFVTLYWADVAQDFLPTIGTRGGASTRIYKNAYLTNGSRQTTHAWSYLYGWHETPRSSAHPMTLVAAASTYTPPALVREQARDRTAPYLYASRRCGRGGMELVNDEPLYLVRFDGGRGSHLLRTSYVTQAYVIGAITFAPNEPYNKLVGQNRAMGVSFASHENDRIVIHGRGLDSDSTTGYNEITGHVTQDVLVVARDPKGKRTAGVRIFIPNGDLWDRRVEYGGWLFTQTDDAYVGIRISKDGYHVGDDPNGHMLDLENSWVPIVIQLGQASEYESFEHFQSSVASNFYETTTTAIEVTKSELTTDSYAQAHTRIRYRSESGDLIKIYSHNRKRPRVNGTPVNLLPTQTYASPFINSNYGDDSVDLHHPIYGTLSLNFEADDS
ncbi:MAG: hypothetical protein ACI8W3_003364 [Myxococcota bacterium]|jgi:hypothetical protein